MQVQWWRKLGLSNEGCFVTGVGVVILIWCVVAFVTTRTELGFWELFCGLPFVLIMAVVLLRRAGHLRM